MKIKVKKLFFISNVLILFLMVIPVHAQQTNRMSMISGKVLSADKKEGVVEFATVYLKGTSYGGTTNEEGIYHLNAPAGKYTLVVSAIGYQTAEQAVTLIKNSRLKLNVTLTPSVEQLDEVVVAGSMVNRVNKSAFNVVAVDTKKLFNTSLDLGHVLDKISGVKIREEGGVGSAAQINLNGFTGKHVKVFMDGVPLEGAGSSFQINNIPASLAKQVEVYKGVVPVDFGGDALEGAINIVTNTSSNTFVDASYSYGSFNTHKSNVSFGYTAKNGFTVQLNAYQNYSDNDYKVKTNDSNRGDSEEKWYRRFHDGYHNEAVIAKVGVVNKPWADRLLLGFTYSHEYAEIQNSNMMAIVFGGKHRKTEGLAPTLNYVKKNLLVKNLDLSVSARYDKTTTNNIDTVARTYYWTGEYINKETQGESNTTLSKFYGKTGSVVANLRYHFADRHYFSINNMYSDYVRKTDNLAANAGQNTAAYYMERYNKKNVLGFSYKFLPSEIWNVMAFGKYYHSYVKGAVNKGGNGAARYELQSQTNDALGYGLAATYNLNRDLQAKASFEKTYRLPTDRELFGDGDLEMGSSDLKPESSRNVNVNVSYTHAFNTDHSVSVDAGFNYRYITDYIIRSIKNGGIGISENHGKVRGMGGDVTVRYFYKNIFSVGGNFSYQDTRDRERHTSYGSESITYGDRVPNIPYMFSNVDAAYNIHGLLGERNTLTFGYNLQYVHEFYWDWESNGAKRNIPMQISHDANVTCSLQDGRYNIALEARNFTNSLLYDNYSLQKPGRSFTVKVRYFFFRQNR